jgi:hypothetical protein
MTTDREIFLKEYLRRSIHYNAAIIPRLIIFKAMISHAIELCYKSDAA